MTFRNGDVILFGTLLRPRNVGLHPGIVLLHGSGPQTRWGTPLFFADRFARGGIAALVFDKRGSGQSTGDWKSINFQELVGDYMAAVHFLQAQPSVNPQQVGIMGHSQGATISPLIAAKPGAVAFVIAAAATGTGPIYTQDLYRTRNDLADRGFTEAEISQAMALYSQWIDIARSGERWDDLERAMVAAKAEAKNEKWFDFLGLPQKKDYWLYKWYPAIGDFNPLPLWEKVAVPVLLVWRAR